MVMAKYVKWLSVIIAGWLLGWHSHQHWSLREPAIATDLPPGSSLSGDTTANATQVDQDNGHGTDQPGLAESTAFEEMLRTGQYRDAMQVFSAQNSRLSREQYRTALIQYLNTLLRLKDYPNADTLLTAYLSEESRDVDVLLLRARLHCLRGNYRQAIETLYDAIYYEYRASKLTLITELIISAVAFFGSQLNYTDGLLARLALF